jgi:hypothetical protein
MRNNCALCGCKLLRKKGVYGSATIEGRSHASRHHYVPERLFGRSGNRPKTLKRPVFDKCPWDLEGKKQSYCYDCHEVLLHNPVLLPEDIGRFAVLIQKRGLGETTKGEGYEKLAGRVKLFQEIIAAGLASLLKERQSRLQSNGRRLETG